MDCIKAMNEVCMEALKIRRDELELERQRGERQWQQDMNELGEHSNGTEETPVLRQRQRPVARRRRCDNFMVHEMNRPVDDFEPPLPNATDQTENKPPSYNAVMTTSQTIPKDFVVVDEQSSSTPRKTSNTSSECRYDESRIKEDTMTSQEASELLDAVKTLTDEQNILKAKLQEHDQHWMSIFARQPSIRHRLSFKTSKAMMSKTSPVDIFTATNETRLDKKIKNEDRVYAQIEQLYANLCRIHIPIIQKNMAVAETYQCGSPNPLAEVAAIDPNPYSTPISSEVNRGLYDENMELKEKIKSLEKTIEEMKQSRIAHTSNDIESLKFESGCESASLDTTDDNIDPCPYYQLVNKDMKQVSSSFEWTIHNYFQKREQEAWGKESCLISPPFYTEQDGYRAQVEVYLNGNGSGKGKCMSVFLSVIKGQYDGYRQWPVKFSVQFVVLNQVDSDVDSLMHESVFEYNNPSGKEECDNTWGVIEFVPHSVINKRNYIKNNDIKLKLRIVKC